MIEWLMSGHSYKPFGSLMNTPGCKKAKEAKRVILLPFLLFLQPIGFISKPLEM
jgi:hypothetical protein